MPLGQVSGQVPRPIASTTVRSHVRSGATSGVGATLLDTLLREAGIGLSPQGGGSSAALNVMQLETGRSRTGAEKDALADSGATLLDLLSQRRSGRKLRQSPSSLRAPKKQR